MSEKNMAQESRKEYALRQLFKKHLRRVGMPIPAEESEEFVTQYQEWLVGMRAHGQEK